MSGRAKQNLFGTPKALRARQTTPASGGVAQHAGRGAARGLADKSLTLGTYQGFRLFKDAEGDFRFSGDPDSAFSSLRAVKGHIDWLKKGRGNPGKMLAYNLDLFPDRSLRGAPRRIFSGMPVKILDRADSGRRLLIEADNYGTPHYGWVDKDAVTLANPVELDEPRTAVVESEIPVFRSGPAGFPGVDYMISYPELNQAVAYAQAVKGVYPHVGVVCLEESEEKLPGGDYAVVQDAAAVRAVEAGQVGTQENPFMLRLRGREKRAAFRASRQFQAGHALGIKDRRAGERPRTDEWLREQSRSRFPDLAPYKQEGFREGYNYAYFERPLSGPKGKLPNPSAAYQLGYADGRNYMGARTVDNPMLIRMAKKRGLASRQDVGDYVSGFQSAIAARRRNPEDTAAHAYEAFHGRPSDRVLEISEEIHEHEWLAEIGALVSFEIETPTGLSAELQFDSDAPKLATNEEGTQLYVRGGNQHIDLQPLKLDGSDWSKESMVLGWIWKLTYQTQKSFDKFETVDYYHNLSEEERGSMEKRRKTLPVLRYDTVNDKLHIDGGKYRIKLPALGVSPGIEN